MNRSIGLAVVISIVLMVARFMQLGEMGALGYYANLALFLSIFALLLYFFLLKQYDTYIIVWLAFYFACPMISVPYLGIGSLGLYNAVFIPLMMASLFNLRSKYYWMIILLTVISVMNISDVGVRQIVSRLFEFVTPLLFFYFAYRKVKDTRLVLRASLVVALVNLPLALYQVIFSPGWGVFTDWRGTRIFGNLFWPNSYSVFLLPVTLLMYSYWREDMDLKSLAGLLALAAANAMTFSRAGLIGLAIAVLLYELFRGGMRFTAKKMVLGLVVLAMVLVYAMNLAAIQQEFTPDTIVERTVIWQDIIPLVKDNLIFGNGIGSYELARSSIVYSLSPHNYYLGVVFEIGVIGLLSIVMFLIFMYRDFFSLMKRRQSLRRGEMGVALLTSLLLISFVGGSPFSQVVALNSWIIMGCLR